MTTSCPPHRGKTMTEMNTDERRRYETETYETIMGTIARGREATEQPPRTMPQTGKRTIAVGRCIDGKVFVITSGHPSLEPIAI